LVWLPAADAYDLNGVYALHNCNTSCDGIDNDCDGTVDEACGEECNSDNILFNGDFEAVDERVGLTHGRVLETLANWDVFDSLPEITDGIGTSWFTDNDTSGIEIQNDGLIVPSVSGDYYVELDSHQNDENGNTTNSTMSQNVTLVHMTAKVASRNGAKWPVSRSEATLAFLS